MGGDKPMYIDMHAIVFAERLALLNNGPWQHGYDKMDVKNAMPNALAWLERYRAVPEVNQFMVKQECCNAHYEDWNTNGVVGTKTQLSTAHLSALDA